MLPSLTCRRRVSLAAAALTLVLICVAVVEEYLDWQIHQARILVRHDPVIAFSDLNRLRIEFGRSRSVAPSANDSGLIIITTTTRCTILRWEQEKSCPSASGLGTNPLK